MRNIMYSTVGFMQVKLNMVKQFKAERKNYI